MANEQRQQLKQQPPPQQGPPSTERIAAANDKAEPGALLPFGSKYREVAKEYLTANHWEPVSEDPYGNKIWNDPNGSRRPCEDIEVRLPITRRDDPRYGDGNQVEVIKQKCGPPPEWVYTTAEAVMVQHIRDEVGDNSRGTPLERLHRIEEELVQHRLLLKDLFFKLENDPELQKPIPAKREEAIAQISRVKVKIAGHIRDARQKLKVG